jgi:hypothetical protein
MMTMSVYGFSGPASEVQSRQLRLLLFLLMLTLPVLACGLLSPQYRRNNEVRLAVYEYERAQRGPVDELIIAFNRNEPRIKFEGQNENGGRTVWLDEFAAREFFELRRPDRSFLYVEQIEYFDNNLQATVTVYRGDGNSYEGRNLTLKRNEAGQWIVIGEAIVQDRGAK